MRRSVVVLAVLLVLPGTVALDPTPARDPRTLVVLFEGSPPEDLRERVGDLGRVQASSETLGFASVRTDAPQAAARLADLPGARLVEPVHRYVPAQATDDPLASEQWGLDAINVTPAWRITHGSHDAKVAILDLGTHRTHPDLRSNTALSDPACGPDVNLVEGGPPVDPTGHGTHVAGTAAAALDNGRGVAGMGNSCLMVVKVCGFYCLGPQVALGILHAAEHGADVISMSIVKEISPLGGTDYQDLLVRRAIEHAASEEVLLVAAAGNHFCSWDPETGESDDNVAFPASHPDVVAVAALSGPEEARENSRCGPSVEIAAPGESILSTFPPHADPLLASSHGAPTSVVCPLECYVRISGTSMATPHVSGVAGLVLDVNPQLSGSQVRCLLTATADDLGPPGRDVRYGYGRLDAGAAVASALTPWSVGC